MTGYDHLRPVAQESTPSIIANKLRAAISEGELAQGAQLNEVNLARRLGVSRSPLREAMQRLTQEGLLVSIRHHGLFVTEMTGGKVRDLYVARGAIETTAAEEIFVGDPVSASGLLLDHRADALEFHRVLVSLAESTRLTRMHETLMTETHICINAVTETERDIETRIADHSAIAESFRAGDSARTVNILRAHLHDAGVRLAAGCERTT